MTPGETALEYVRQFAAGDVEALRWLLHEKLELTGPYLTARSSAEYLAALRDDPPLACSARVLSITEQGDEVAVFYEYQKPDDPIIVAQWFRLQDRKIRETRIVF